jgi:type IV pilus assembly protein PilE
MNRFTRRKRTIGFTLLELLMALAVLAILAAIAYPSYRQSIINGRRADGSTALLDLANRMEQYYAQNNTFATATVAAGVAATDVLTSNVSAQGYYTVSIEAQAANTYTIRASRAGAQTVDTLCGDFKLTSAGVKIVTGTFAVARCW